VGIPLPPGSLPAAALISELLGFGLAIGLSPPHIALLLLVLLGPQPLRRGSWFVAAWLITSLLEVLLLVSLGHGLLLSMEKGSSHRTGLDLLAAGGLLALGLNELLVRQVEGEPPAWSQRLDRFGAMPLPGLLAVSIGLQVASPDDLFLYARAAGSLLASGFDRLQELALGLAFSLSTTALLVLPLLTLLLLGRERVLPRLEGGKRWLFANGDRLVGGLSLLLACYLGWQGIEGLGGST
jgi:hypothetical protein